MIVLRTTYIKLSLYGACITEICPQRSQISDTSLEPPKEKDQISHTRSKQALGNFDKKKRTSNVCAIHNLQRWESTMLAIHECTGVFENHYSCYSLEYVALDEVRN